MNKMPIILTVLLANLQASAQSPLHTIECDTEIAGVALSSDGRSCAIGTGNAKTKAKILIVDMQTGKHLAELSEGLNTISGLAYLDSDKKILSLETDGTLRLWDVKARTSIGIIKVLKRSTSLESVSGNCLVLTHNSRLDLYDVKLGQILAEVPYRGSYGECSQFTLSADGALLVTGTNSELTEMVPKTPASISVWDLNKNAKISTFDGQQRNNITVLGVDASKSLLGIGYFFKGRANLELYSVKTGKIVGSSDDHKLPPRAISFSPDSKYMISGDYEGKIIVWDVRNQLNKVKLFKAHSHSVESIKFTPDGVHVISTGYDQKLKVWLFKDLLR